MHYGNKLFALNETYGEYVNRLASWPNREGVVEVLYNNVGKIHKIVLTNSESYNRVSIATISSEGNIVSYHHIYEKRIAIKDGANDLGIIYSLASPKEQLTIPFEINGDFLCFKKDIVIDKKELAYEDTIKLFEKDTTAVIDVINSINKLIDETNNKILSYIKKMVF